MSKDPVKSAKTRMIIGVILLVLVTIGNLAILFQLHDNAGSNVTFSQILVDWWNMIVFEKSTIIPWLTTVLLVFYLRWRYMRLKAEQVTE